MLVLTRQAQKSILLSHPDGEITINILEISGSNIRIGIKAPKSVMVLRDDAKSLPAEITNPSDTSFPCVKCCQPSWTLNGLCFGCDQAEQGD
jgi:carbon storage regulator CsrA